MRALPVKVPQTPDSGPGCRAQVLAYLGRSLASFCSNQWREDASPAHLDQMVRAGLGRTATLEREGPNLSVDLV